MNYKNISIVLLLCSINNVHAKRTGTTQAPITQPTQPRTPIIQPQQTPVIEKGQQFPFMGARYSEIFSILKDKAPDSSDFATLKNIKGEAEYKINLIKERKRDVRAKVFNIKSADDIETYSDIYNALKQNSADSSDFSTLNNIKNEAEKQMRQLEEAVQKKPTIQPIIQPAMGEMRYNEILNALKKNVPNASDLQTLQNIIYEAERQMKTITKTVSQPSGKPIIEEFKTPQEKQSKGSSEQIILAENLTKQKEQELIKDLFPKEGEFIKDNTITNITINFMNTYPNAEQSVCVSTIYDAIINNKAIKARLDQNVKRNYIMKAIHNILKDSWIAIKDAQQFQ